LKTDVRKFEDYLEEKYGALNDAKDKLMRKLFDKIPMREGTDRELAYELINTTMDSFNKSYLSELTDENKLYDETYWQSFFEKKNSFLNMMRYGIEQKGE